MADPGTDARKELDWDLHINVPTQGVRKSVRVTSDESVGALMIKIAEKLGGSLLSTQLWLAMYQYSSFMRITSLDNHAAERKNAGFCVLAYREADACRDTHAPKHS